MMNKVLLVLILVLASMTSEAKIKSTERLRQSEGIGYSLIRTIEKITMMETSGLMMSTSGRKLYESAYINGQSFLVQMKYPSCEVIKSIPLENGLKGSGIGQCHYHLFQLTTNSRSALEYRYPYDLKYLEAITLPNEMNHGYGLTKFDHKTLVASDGTNRIFFLDCYRPLKVNNILNVFNGTNTLRDINALAVFGNYIYATVYRRNNIYKIDSSTGQVVKIYNLEDLASNEYNQRTSFTNNSNNNSNSDYDKWENWLPWDTSYDYTKYDGSYINGIAYDINSKNFIVTGKNWRYLYIISLN